MIEVTDDGRAHTKALFAQVFMDKEKYKHMSLNKFLQKVNGSESTWNKDKEERLVALAKRVTALEKCVESILKFAENLNVRVEGIEKFLDAEDVGYGTEEEDDDYEEADEGFIAPEDDDSEIEMAEPPKKRVRFQVAETPDDHEPKDPDEF